MKNITIFFKNKLLLIFIYDILIFIYEFAFYHFVKAYFSFFTEEIFSCLKLCGV